MPSPTKAEGTLTRRPGEIAAAVGLTPAAVTALLDRLEQRGLVARSRSDEDRRQVRVALTDKAIKATMNITARSPRKAVPFF